MKFFAKIFNRIQSWITGQYVLQVVFCETIYFNYYISDKFDAFTQVVDLSELDEGGKAKISIFQKGLSPGAYAWCEYNMILANIKTKNGNYWIWEKV